MLNRLFIRPLGFTTCALRDAARVMVEYQIRRLPVVKDENVVRILAAADLARQLSHKSFTEYILEVIARYPSELEY